MTNVIGLTKKAFTWSVIALTIAWSMGIAAFVPTVAQAATLSAGDLIRIEGNSAVYLLNADLERMYFPNSDVYSTWYEDFSGVNVVSPAEASAYRLAPKGVNYRPGSRLVKMTDLPTVYAIGSGNMLHPIANGDVAVGLYGANWGAILRDLPPFWFLNYTVGDELTEVVPHEGMIVSEEGSDAVYFVQDGELVEVEGSTARFADDVKSVSADVIGALNKAASTVTAGNIVEDPSQGFENGEVPGNDDDDDNEPVADGGDVTVRLSASTPASDTVPGGAQAVPYLTYTVSAGSDDARIEAVTFTRRGIGSDDDFDKVYLFVDGERVDSGRSLNSDDEVRFSPNYTVRAGDSVTMMVKADMDLLTGGNATSGASNRFEIISSDDVELDGGDVSGSFPIRGNDQVIGSVDIGAITVSEQGNNVTVEIGEADVKISEFELANGSTSDDVELVSIRLENKGSADADILSNIMLYNGGNAVAEGDVMDDYIVFEFDEPVIIEEGDDENFRVMADIGVADSSDTIRLVLDETTDIEAYSTDFSGYRARITNASLNTANAMLVTLAGGEINVDFEGTNEDIADDEDNLVFGVFSIVATAEDIDVDSIQFQLNKGANDICLEDLRIRDMNNRGSYTLEEVTGQECATVGTQARYEAEDLILEQGVVYEFELVADTANNAAAGDQYSFLWNAASTTAEGVSSDNAIVEDDYSSATLTGPTMTVAAPSLTVRSSALTDETVVNGVENLLVFRGTMEAARVSDMTLTTMTVGENGVGDWDGLVAGLELYIGENIDPETDTPVDRDNSVDSGEAVFDGFEYTIEAGSANEVMFEIYADLEDGQTVGNITVEVQDLEASDEDGDQTFGIDSDGAEIDSANEVVSSRTITVQGTGSLDLVIDNNMTGLRNARYVLAGDDSYLVGRIKLQADNEDVKLTDLVMVASSTALDGNTTAFEETFENVSLYTSADLSGDSMIASEDMVSGTITFEDVDYIVEDNQTQYLYIGIDVNSIGTDADGTATSSMDVTFKVLDAGLGAEGVDSGDDLAAGNITADEDVATNNVEVVGVSISDVSSNFSEGTLTGGSNKTIFSFTVTADAGRNSDDNGEALEAELQRLSLEISSDLGTNLVPNVTSTQLCRQDTGNCISLETAAPLSDTVSVTNFVTDGDAFIDMTNFADRSDYEVESGETVEYVVKATISNVQDNSAVQVVVTDLDNDGLRWGYDVDGGSSAVDDFHTDLRKDAPRGTDYPRVVGGSLNNN